MGWEEQGSFYNLGNFLKHVFVPETPSLPMTLRFSNIHVTSEDATQRLLELFVWNLPKGPLFTKTENANSLNIVAWIPTSVSADLQRKTPPRLKMHGKGAHLTCRQEKPSLNTSWCIWLCWDMQKAGSSKADGYFQMQCSVWGWNSVARELADWPLSGKSGGNSYLFPGNELRCRFTGNARGLSYADGKYGKSKACVCVCARVHPCRCAYVWGIMLELGDGSPDLA